MDGLVVMDGIWLSLSIHLDHTPSSTFVAFMNKEIRGKTQSEPSPAPVMRLIAPEQNGYIPHFHLGRILHRDADPLVLDMTITKAIQHLQPKILCLPCTGTIRNGRSDLLQHQVETESRKPASSIAFFTVAKPARKGQPAAQTKAFTRRDGALAHERFRYPAG